MFIHFQTFHQVNLHPIARREGADRLSPPHHVQKGLGLRATCLGSGPSRGGACQPDGGTLKNASRSVGPPSDWICLRLAAFSILYKRQHPVILSPRPYYPYSNMFQQKSNYWDREQMCAVSLQQILLFCVVVFEPV